MRIIYDGQIYLMQTAGGINRYFANIITRLPESFIPTLITVDRNSKLNYPVHPKLSSFKYKKFRPYRISNLIETYFFRKITDKNKFAIAHPTYYSLLTKREISEYRCPVIITVHDMIHEIFANQLDPKGQEVEIKRKAIFAAQAIICVSQNTKKDLLERYAIPEEKVTVTYLASELDTNLAYGSEQIPSRPYYLYVGSRIMAYKNFDGLLLAFSKAVSINPDIALCIVGPPFNETELKLINELKLTNHIEHYTHVGDRHLAKLYRCSVAFVYPSLYEGFGIPPLEAMACGTVVVASNSSSIPEVVGDAGILFNPKATGDLADILLSLVDSSEGRNTLITKGYERAKMFNWDKTVVQTLDVYSSVV